MAFDKRVLHEILLEASNREPPGDAEVLSERVRAALLLNSSNAPESCVNVDGIAYAVSEGWRGIVIGGTDVSLSALTECLAGLDAVPTVFADEEPDLGLEEFRAAMLVVTALLRGYEGPAEDETVDREG